MALAKVAKINIIAHQKHQHDFLEVLQNSGFTQLEDYTGEDLEKTNLNEKISKLDYQLAGIKFSLDFLAHYETEKKSLNQKLNPKFNLKLIEIEKIVTESNLEEKIKTIQEIEKGINEANNLKEKVNLELKQIKPWEKLGFTTNQNQPNDQTKFNFKFISADENKYHDLIKKIEKNFPLSIIERVDEIGNGKKREILSVVIYQKEKEDKIAELLMNANVKIVELPALDKTIPERIKQMNQQTDEADSKIEKLTKEAEKLALNQKNLKIAFDYYTWKKEKLINQQKAGKTWQTFSLIGWIDVDSIETLKKELEKMTTDFIVEEIKINEDEVIPIIFKNSWAQAFEAVTNIYGSPGYKEPDPTPFLAPFFILFFGLCLTDAGYGIILALLAWLGIKIFKIPKENQKLFRVLMYGGIATFIAGALVGGWLGITIDNIKIEWLRNLLVGIRVIDPVKNPISMLIFCLGLGVIQVFTGIIISIYWKIKHGDLKDAILDDVTWLYFLIVLLLFGGHKAGLVDFSASVYLVYIGVAGLVLTQGRRAKNPLLKVAGGVLSLYGVVGYFSDVLSYSRLLALGLATGIIAMVINLIAQLTIDMVPYLGWVIAVFILIGGHLFNIIINALGAFIHSSRLQFVEFFPKFMGEGGGVPFVPFKKESKYTRIKN